MIIGDGKGKTVITGGKNVMQNLTTFHTASFGKFPYRSFVISQLYFYLFFCHNIFTKLIDNVFVFFNYIKIYQMFVNQNNLKGCMHDHLDEI